MRVTPCPGAGTNAPCEHCAGLRGSRCPLCDARQQLAAVTAERDEARARSERWKALAGRLRAAGKNAEGFARQYIDEVEQCEASLAAVTAERDAMRTAMVRYVEHHGPCAPHHAMTEHPVIFSGPMVRAILAGAKTQTRRLITHRHGISFLGGSGQENDPACWGYAFDGPDHYGYMVIARGLDERHDHGLISLPCPYGVPGDRLWVKETFAVREFSPTKLYRATDVLSDSYLRWKPSIYMPRAFSRITLLVESVRVERLQDITEEDARAEGVAQTHAVRHGDGLARQNFALLWQSINAKRATWASNPWVWRVEFSQVTP